MWGVFGVWYGPCLVACVSCAYLWVSGIWFLVPLVMNYKRLICIRIWKQNKFSYMSFAAIIKHEMSVFRIRNWANDIICLYIYIYTCVSELGNFPCWIIFIFWNGCSWQKSGIWSILVCDVVLNSLNVFGLMWQHSDWYWLNIILRWTSISICSAGI